MTAEELRVSGSVVRELIRLAASDVPGVVRIGRGGPRWRRRLGGDPVHAVVRKGEVDVTVWLIARGGASIPRIAETVRAATADTIERLLALRTSRVTVVVDGVAG